MNAGHLPESDVTPTVWVVWCGKHQHYLKFVSSTGTTWRSGQRGAKVYESKVAARKDAERATWLDHDPTPWAISPPERGAS